jgi:hypothetical protein
VERLATRPPAPAPGAHDSGDRTCRSLRDRLARAVSALERDRGGAPVNELRLFDLIAGGYLDEIVDSCPDLGGYVLEHEGGMARVRCTVHGS